MGMTAEAGNHVPMAAGLRGRVLQDPAQLRWGLRREFLGEPDCHLHARELLGVTQRQKEERLLPGRRQRRIVTDLDTLTGQCESLRILGECVRRSSVERARELIEDL
jgi:hypothetical protein